MYVHVETWWTIENIIGFLVEHDEEKNLFTENIGT